MKNNELMIFKNEEFGSIRTVDINGEIWSIANEIAEKLGYTNTSKATKDHCKKVKMWWGNDLLGRLQTVEGCQYSRR